MTWEWLVVLIPLSGLLYLGYRVLSKPSRPTCIMCEGTWELGEHMVLFAHGIAHVRCVGTIQQT